MIDLDNLNLDNIEEAIKEVVPEYFRIIKSEEIVKYEMSKFDEKYIDVNKEKLERFERLFLFAEKHNIDIDYKLFDFDLNSSDIRERIDEQLQARLSKIYKRYHDRNNFGIFNAPMEKIYDIVISGISNKYEKIYNNIINDKLNYSIITKKTF